MLICTLSRWQSDDQGCVMQSLGLALDGCPEPVLLVSRYDQTIVYLNDSAHDKHPDVELLGAGAGEFAALFPRVAARLGQAVAQAEDKPCAVLLAPGMTALLSRVPVPDRAGYVLATVHRGRQLVRHRALREELTAALAVRHTQVLVQAAQAAQDALQAALSPRGNAAAGE